MTKPNSPKPSPVGCGPIAFALVLAFVFFTLSASIPPLNNFIARLMLCPTAEGVYFTDKAGGVVDKPGVQSDVSTTTVTMFCEYTGGVTRTIENDTVFLAGSAGSIGSGLLTGLVVYGIIALRARLSPSTS